MAKVIGKLKLAPYVPAWYDMINEIHLVRPHHVSQEVKEGADIEPIMRGVQAGYVIFEEVAEEVKEEMKALEPQVIGVDMKAPETPVAKKKRKSKKKAEEEKVENPSIDEIEGGWDEPANGFEE
jgi:hypothetical protein